VTFRALFTIDELRGQDGGSPVQSGGASADHG